ncbi:MAG: acyl-CoA dehydrogenase family protein [Burkholderiaceae bacterium]
MFAEAIEEILKDQCTPAAVRAIEAGETPARLWSAVADAGYLELLAPEEAGGAGLPLAELFPILTTLGRYAAPLPLAQSIAARSLLSHASDIPAGMLTFAPALRRMADGRLVCPAVPFGALAEYVLAEDAGGLLLLDCVDALRTPTGVHGSQVATLAWNADSPGRRLAGAGAELATFSAALYAALLAGAMQRVFDMTLQYANDRSQFGKSIGKFQAIQHQISVMAEHVAAASIAAEAAFQSDTGRPAALAAAIAKSRASEAAQLVASTAHAVHGAIGITEEYDLQLFTRRLHDWRMAHGSEMHWDLIIGRAVLDSEAPTVTDFVHALGA